MPSKNQKKKMDRVKSLRKKEKKVNVQTPLHVWLYKLKYGSDWVDVKSKHLPKVTTGSQRVSDLVYVPQDTTAAASFVSLNKVYTFRLAGAASLSYSTGVINTFYACDPSASGVNFGEWSTLSALFSEFRMKKFSIHFVSNFQTDIYGYGGLYICGNLGTATNPGSTAAIADNADSVVWAGKGDRTSRGYHHVIHGTQLGWSQVTTPTVEPFAGAPGSIQIYGVASAAATGDYQLIVEGIYEFRSRV